MGYRQHNTAWVPPDKVVHKHFLCLFCTKVDLLSRHDHPAHIKIYFLECGNADTFTARLKPLQHVRRHRSNISALMGFAVRVRSAGQKYGPTCHQRDRADVTEFVTLVRLSSLGQHVGVLALAGYKRRKSALTAGPIGGSLWRFAITDCITAMIPCMPDTSVHPLQRHLHNTNRL